MRELPEIETIRRELDKEVSGKKVKTVDVPGTMSAVTRHPNKKQFASKLEGVKVKSVSRRALILFFTLDSGDVLVVDIGATGSIRRATPKEAMAPETQVIVTFTQGGQMRLVDGGETAWMSVISADDLEAELPGLNALGLDPVETPVSWTHFAEMLRGQKTKLKAFLCDQTVLVGLGDLYADEILFAAGLRPDRVAGSLTTQEIRRLYRSLVETLHDAIKYRGTSLDADPFVDVHGKAGDYQQYVKVHGRDKEACRRCRTPIVKVRSGGTTTYLCEQCQV